MLTADCTVKVLFLRLPEVFIYPVITCTWRLGWTWKPEMLQHLIKCLNFTEKRDLTPPKLIKQRVCVCAILFSDPDWRLEGFHHFALIMPFTTAALDNYVDFIYWNRTTGFSVNDLGRLREISGNSLSRREAAEQKYSTFCISAYLNGISSWALFVHPLSVFIFYLVYVCVIELNNFLIIQLISCYFLTASPLSN